MTDFIWFTRRWWTCMWEWYCALLFEFSWRCRLAFQWRVTAFVKNVFLIMCVLSMYISEVHFEICVFLICPMHTSCCGRQDCLIYLLLFFLHLLCSPCFYYFAHRPSSLSLPPQRQDSEDLAVKGVAEEVRSKVTVYPLSAILLQQQPLPATRCDASVAVSKAIKVWIMQKNRGPGSQKICLSEFLFSFFFYFTANFQSAILLWCYLEINVVSLVKHPPSKQFLTWHENNHLQPGTKWKCPSVLSPRFQAVRDESAHVSAGLQY